MTYTELVTLIKTACLASSDGTFAKGRRPDAGFASVNGNGFPLMFLYYPDFNGQGRNNDTARISMLFLKQDDVNNSDESREDIHNDMKELCELFLTNFVNSVEAPGTTAQYNYDKRITIEDRILAGAFSGVGLSFTITTKSKQC